MAKTAAIDVRVERAEFDKAVKRLIAVSPKIARDVVTDAAEAFMLAATKETPPMEGKGNIPKKKYKRDIVTKTDDDIDKFERIRLKLGRRSATIHAVKYRTSKKRGTKLFTAMKDAKEFAKIKFRGIARAGWFLGLIKIGRQLAAAHSAILRNSPDIKGKDVNSVNIKFDTKGNGGITITNQADAIERIAKKSEVLGLRKAKNKMNASARIFEKRMRDKWL